MSGFVKLHRRFFSHWLWEEERTLSRAEAFLDLVQLAAHAHTTRVINGTIFKLEPGELCGSERYLSDRWKWSTKKVRAYLTLLEADSMVELRKKRQGSTIFLRNYKRFHDWGSTKEAQSNHRGSTEEAPRKQIQEGREGKESSSSPDLSDFDDDDDGFAGLMPTTNAGRMTALQGRINALHPSWKKRPHFSAKELHTLHENAKAWLSVTDDDWELLTSYMAAAIPDAWRRDPRDYFQPDNRQALLTIGATSILGVADKWVRECRRRNIPTGLEPKPKSA